MEVSLVKINDVDLIQYKKDMQEAFQKGFEDVYGKTEDIILPEEDIECSLNKKGAIAYKSIVDGKMSGGAVVVIDDQTQHNHLELFYVKSEIQTKGIGYAIWREIEKLHPNTKIWETSTPYFDRRNIHFYINKCSFHIVEFQHEYNSSSGRIEDFMGQGMFVFQKRM